MNKALARWQQDKYNELVKYMRKNKIKKAVEYIKLMPNDIVLNNKQRHVILCSYYNMNISTIQDAILHSELKWRLIKLDSKIMDTDDYCGFCYYFKRDFDTYFGKCDRCLVSNICDQHIEDPDLALAILEDLKQWEDKTNG